MTRWGIGPKFTIVSVIYAVIIMTVQETIFSEIRFVIYSKSVNIILGVLLISVGLIIFLMPALTIDKYFYAGRLCTKGIYAYLRHPLYASWITLIVPGIVLIRGSVLGLTVPLFMYLIFRVLIPAEERYLLNQFGDEYIAYKSKVGAVFPKLWGR
jgi:protein-S-isoprenylcysteine O-methyltransferase Ste14